MMMHGEILPLQWLHTFCNIPVNQPVLFLIPIKVLYVIRKICVYWQIPIVHFVERTVICNCLRLISISSQLNIEIVIIKSKNFPHYLKHLDELLSK